MPIRAVNSNAPFLVPTLSYDANDVYLDLQIGGFAQAAQTPTPGGGWRRAGRCSPGRDWRLATVLARSRPSTCRKASPP